ncbi:hypothetical protein MPNT_10224 [Candidatus Methylacidithermus pantelleriae]|uniref:Uncharacterized protein n=1 Tax=Candidatus Methylacidithermus pantelleriae TaxID=2744239 RepID=A0A8J2BK97_9BACT|nr:hypothetical protein MPNT_10224 [Candidatus Methylacidithermus pantelleriae]
MNKPNGLGVGGSRSKNQTIWCGKPGVLGGHSDGNATYNLSPMGKTTVQSRDSCKQPAQCHGWV